METAPFLFIRPGIITVCYVDDVFLFARDERIIDEVTAELRELLLLKDLGERKQILGTDLKWKREGSLLISETMLITKLLNDTGLQNAKNGGRLIDPSSKESIKR